MYVLTRSYAICASCRKTSTGRTSSATLSSHSNIYPNRYFDSDAVSSISNRSKSSSLFCSAFPFAHRIARTRTRVKSYPRFACTFSNIFPTEVSALSNPYMLSRNYWDAFRSYGSRRYGGLARPRIVRNQFLHGSYQNRRVCSCDSRSYSSTISFLRFRPRGAS
jgi:hypothetical protein